MAKAPDRREEIGRALERMRQDLPQTSAASSRHVRSLVRYVHAHLFDAGLNVTVARSACRLRDNNVSSLFRHEVGCSIKDYIDGLRMEAARRLLRDRTFSIFEIGRALGYTHPQTFYRVYRRHFGTAPASARRTAPAGPGVDAAIARLRRAPGKVDWADSPS